MVRDLATLKFGHVVIELICLQPFICLAFAVVFPINRLVELDLIQQLENREWIGPVDKDHNRMQVEAPLEHALNPWVGPDPAFLVPDLNIPHPEATPSHTVRAELDEAHLGVDYNTSRATFNRCLTSDQACCCTPVLSRPLERVYYNSYRQPNQKNMARSYTTYPRPLIQTHECLSDKLHASDVKPQASDRQPSGKRESFGVDLDHSLESPESSSLTARKRSRSAQPLRPGAKKPQVLNNRRPLNSAGVAIHRLPSVLVSNNSEKRVVDQQSAFPWTHPRTRPRTNLSIKKPDEAYCRRLSLNYATIGPDPASVPASLQKHRLRNTPHGPKAPNTTSSGTLKSSRSSGIQIADTLTDYQKIRAEILFGQKLPSENVRIRNFLLVIEVLGSLEFNKLGLKKEMDEISFHVKKRWKMKNTIDSDELKKLEIMNKHRHLAIIFATKTALYLMDVVSNMYVPCIYRTEELLNKAKKEAFYNLKTFWMSPNIWDTTKASRILSKISSKKPLEMLALAWCATSVWMKQKLPEIHREVTHQGKNEFNRTFKLIVIDKTFQEASKKNLFESFGPEWWALCSIDVMVKLPKTHTSSLKLGLKGGMTDTLKSSQADNEISGHAEAYGIAVGSVLWSYYKFRQDHVFLPKELTRRLRKDSIFSNLATLGEFEIVKLKLEGSEKSFITDIVPFLSKTYPSKMKKDNFERSLRERIHTIIFATRATIYLIKAINRLCLPPLFNSRNIEIGAQKSAFQILERFWYYAYSGQFEKSVKGNSQGYKYKNLSDILVLKTLESLNNRSGKHSYERMDVTWIATSYWMRETFPDFYEKIAPAGSVERIFKWLVIDKIFEAVNKSRIDNPNLKKWNLKFKKPFMLQRPI